MTLRPLIRDLVRGPLRSPLDRRGGFDPDAAAWAAAVTAAGGTYSGTTLNAVSIFVRSAKASGYWTKLNRINLFCGNQLAACLVPLKVGNGSATDTNVNHVAGDYTEATGLTGNATSKYLNTGLLASALTTNDTHFALYNRASVVSGAAALSAISGVNEMGVYGPFSDGIAYSEPGTASSGVAIAAPFGFIVASRTASNSNVIYRNAVSVGSSATAGAAGPAFAIYLGARNNGGVADRFNGMPLAGYSIGSGLTAGDVTAYNTHIQAFQAALGRSV